MDGEKMLDYEAVNQLSGIIDRLMTREFVSSFPFEEMLRRILFSEPFVSCLVEKNLATARRDSSGEIVGVDSDVNLRVIIQKRVRHNLSPVVSRFR
jgi:hypothetical protein